MNSTMQLQTATPLTTSSDKMNHLRKHKSWWRHICVLCFSLLLLPSVRAELTLPNVIADHMVLQQQMSNPIWGWDTAGTKITVTFAGRTYTTTTGDDGRWQVTLAPQPANATPQELIVEGSTKRVIQDVLIGEVWLCSGQSNMEMGIGMVQNGAEEIAHADYPDVRLLMVQNRWTPQPQTNIEGDWKACSPKSIAEGGWNGFSATAYFFGRELRQKLGVPVGLIEPDWGGTRIESWTAPEGFAAVPALKRDYDLIELGDPKTAVHQQHLASFLDQTATWLESGRNALKNQTICRTDADVSAGTVAAARSAKFDGVV